MTEPYIGEIRCFGFNFAPRGYAFCNGQLMSIAQNSALYAILGTTYGGDGQTTFALPNLQGQIPMHWGSSPSAGLTTVLGEVMGQTTVTLTTSQMPQHNHAIMAATPGDPTERTAAPTTQSYLSNIKGGFVWQKAPLSINAAFSPKAITLTGGSQPHDNMQPYLTLNFCIALEGIFPQQG